MNEFVKLGCACDVGCDKGALKKTVENNIFTIFGNLYQKNSIVIRYHGLLTEKNDNISTAFNMFYYFDTPETGKKIIRLEKCTKCAGECYCATIDLDLHHSLNFGFFDDSSNYELNLEAPFKLEIVPDPISNLMQKYGLEQNTNLPTCDTSTGKMFELQNILCAIKRWFSNMFVKTRSI